MKRILLIVLAIVLLTSLCACTDAVTGSATTEPATSANVAQSLTLGYYKDGDPKTVTDYDLKQLLEYDEIHNLVLANYIGTDLSILT